VNETLLFLLLGLGTGATIAAIAVGVVITYRGSGFINLAAGAIAMLAGFSFWALRTGELGFTVGTPLAIVLSYVFVIVVGVVIELAVFRPLRTAPPLAKLVASLGVLLTLQATMLLAFGTSQHPQPTVIPVHVFLMLDGAVPLFDFVLSGAVVVITVLLWALYRWTRFGLATRAASENDVAARLAGLSPNELSLANTILASLLLGTLGIFAGSVASLDTTTLPFLVVPALAAALFARLTSFAIACACGLGIGMLESLIEFESTKSWFPTSEGAAWPGVKELLVFVLIVAAMFLRGASLPTRGELVEQRLPYVPRPKHPFALAIPSTALCAVALVVLPFDFRQALTNSLIGIVMALSLVVITGFVGQISVVQLALAGVAGFTVSHLAVDAGIGFPLAPLAGIAAAVVLGLVTAVSALRVRGVALAVVTIAAAVAVFNFGFQNGTWGGGPTGSPVPDPHLFGVNLGPTASYRGLDGNLPSPVFGWVALGATVLLCLLVVSVRRGTLGRRMLAVRSNERAAAGAAIDVRNVKLTAFGISALIAGVAGTLYAYNFGSVSADRFSVPLALSLIAFAYAGGITLVSGAVFAGLIAAQGIVPYALDKWFGLSGNWFLLFGGVVLIFTLIQNPEGVAGSFYRTAQARMRQRESKASA
jgi:branched-chain amino acid transport system permease protein